MLDVDQVLVADGFERTSALSGVHGLLESLLRVEQLLLLLKV